MLAPRRLFGAESPKSVWMGSEEMRGEAAAGRSGSSRPGSVVSPYRPWAMDAEEVLDDLDVSVEEGLSGEEAERRLERFGPNELRRHRVRGPWEIWVDQFRSVVVLLLAGASALSFGFGASVEGAAIVAVLLINAAIGFVTEFRAVRSMEALRRLGDVRTRVRRGGRSRVVPASELVRRRRRPG